MKFNINRYLIDIMKTLGADVSVKKWKNILASRKHKCFCWQDYCNGRTAAFPFNEYEDVVIDTPRGGFIVDVKWCDKEVK